jgi:hypothetical protein
VNHPEEYVLARRVLLDGLQALRDHLDALILVGAQAVYHHTGDAELSVAPTTTDADIALNTMRLADEPPLSEALRRAGFSLGRNPGTWYTPAGVQLDLMVPEVLAGPAGRRGARLPAHGNQAARKTSGLEPAIIDSSPIQLTALDPIDDRRFTIKIAGPTALLIAKLTKIEERFEDARRLAPKDGLDVLRLLQTTETAVLARTLRTLETDPLSAAVTRSAVEFLRREGAHPQAALPTVAVQAVGVLEEPETIAASMAFLVQDLLDSYGTLD